MASLWHDIYNAYRWDSWQKMLLTKVFHHGVVDETDIEAALQNLVENRDYTPDVPDDDTPSRVSAQTQENAEPTILSQIYDPVGAGLLKENQKITFPVKGLTIVYGRNGSGKSTFCHLLKLACGARDGTKVLPNGFKTEVVSPGVKVDYLIGQTVAPTHDWLEGQTTTPELGKVRFFTRLYQTSCINVGLNKPNIGILPEHISMMISIKDACEKVAAKLEVKRNSTWKSLQNIVLPSETNKSPTIAALLTTITDPLSLASVIDEAWAKLRPLVSLTSDQELEYKRLQLLVKENTDKVKDAEQLTSSSEELSRLNNSLNKASEILTASTIDAVKELLALYQQTQADVMKSKEITSEAYPIKATGSPLWQAFIKSAETFGKEAYPDITYPHKISLPGHCLLCQQDLNEPSRQRLGRFFDLIRTDLEQSLGAIQVQIQTKREAIEAWQPVLHSISSLTKDKYLKEVLPSLEALEEKAVEAQKTLLEALSNPSNKVEVWPDINIFGGNILPKMQITVDQTNALSSAAGLEQSQEAIQAAQNSLNEIQGIRDLFPYMETYQVYINLRKELLRLEDAKSRTNLQGLRSKITTSRKEHISQGLATCINNELVEFGLSRKRSTTSNLQGNIEAQFQPQTTADDEDTIRLTVKGLTNTVRLSSILSEGEQRALALACFFGELDDQNSNGDRSAIVFDDPAASFDYDKVNQITKRIAKEGLKRQVIVFTHDVWFGYRLMQAYYKASSGQSPMVHSLEHDGLNAGLVSLNACPWIMQNSSDKAATLRATLTSISDISTEGVAKPEDARRFYSMLYEAWEGLIEDTLFGKAVTRFKLEISPSSLHGLQIEQEDYWEINDAMKEASYYRHLQPTEGELDFTIEAMNKAVKRFDDYRIKLKRKTSDNKKKRPEYGRPTSPLPVPSANTSITVQPTAVGPLST